MKPFFAALLILTAVPFRGAHADADVVRNSSFSAGRYWQGAAYSFQGKFAYCAITAKFQTTSLYFSLSNNFKAFTISLSDPSWLLPVKQVLYANISLDSKYGGSYKGVAETPKLITFWFNPDADFVKALTLGRTLRITTSKQRWRFNLLGTEDALPQLVKCTAAYSDEGGQNNPFDSRKPMTSNPFDQQGRPASR